jgi:GNAT superfamily N-acetyltransferase
MEVFFDDREVLADTLTSYYTDYEPESLFVAEFAGKIIGYLTGCIDTRKKERTFSRVILPKIMIDFVKKGLIFERKTSRFLFSTCVSFLKGEFSTPGVIKEYPAHLHINIDDHFRRNGVGRRLLQVFFEYLKEHNIRKVHLSTFSEEGKDFFIRAGFILLNETKTSLWRYLLKRDIKTWLFGLSLSP